MTETSLDPFAAGGPLFGLLDTVFPRSTRSPAELRLCAALLRCCRDWSVTAESDLLLRIAADPPLAARSVLRAAHGESRPAQSVISFALTAQAARQYVTTLLHALSARRGTAVVSLATLSAAPAPVSLFTTGCAGLDALLCGGLRGRQLTEVYGEAGSGKTQLALQALVHAALRGLRGGVAALCLAAEDVPCARLAQLAAAAAPRAELRDRVLASVHIRRVAGLREVVRLLRDGSLRAAFRARGGRGVVVVDSVAAHDADAAAAAAAGALLKAFAVEEAAAVLATNQVRAHAAPGPPLAGPRAGQPLVVPALGAQWAVAPHVRVRLRRPHPAGAARQLSVLSGPAHPPLTGTFVIDKDGIRAEG